MSALNPLIEPGDTAEPLIPREEPEATPEPEKVEPVKEAEPVKEPEKAPDDDRVKYENVRKALKEEREEKARLKADFEALNERAKKFDALEAELRERREQQAEERTRKEFEENPAEFLLKQQMDLAKKLDAAADVSKKERESGHYQQQLINAIQIQTSAFRSETPDYDEAFHFMHDRRMAEFEVLGVPPEYREQQFIKESIEFGEQALRAGKNPGELAYNMAKAWGFSGKKETKSADPNKTVERLQEGAKAAQTLSEAGSGEKSVLKKVDSESDAEFDKFWKEEMEPTHR